MKFFKISELRDAISNGDFQIVEMESMNNPTSYFMVAKKI
jgi:hypothetical protein